MAKKTKDTDYLFISALLRARESKLLGKERAERMLSAKSLSDAVHVLSECGYGEITVNDIHGIEKLIAERRADVIHELEGLVPDKRLVNIFQIKYDYHNAKVLIKAESTGQDPLSLMSTSGIYPPDKLRDDYIKDDLGEYPPIFADAIRDSKGVLARTADPQLSDIIMDMAYFKQFSDIAAESGSVFLMEYTRLLIDSVNLRTAVRVLRMGKNAEFLKKVFIPGGITPLSAFEERIEAGVPISDSFLDTRLHSAALLGDKALNGGSMTAFERECDNALTAFASSTSFVSFGDAVVVSYLHAFENELSAVRIIMTGLVSGLAPDAIKERLRDFNV